jgi:hypothetical protein
MAPERRDPHSQAYCQSAGDRATSGLSAQTRASGRRETSLLVHAQQALSAAPNRALFSSALRREKASRPVGQDGTSTTLAIARRCPKETRGVREAGQTFSTGCGRARRQTQDAPRLVCRVSAPEPSSPASSGSNRTGWRRRRWAVTVAPARACVRGEASAIGRGRRFLRPRSAFGTRGRLTAPRTSSKPSRWGD